MRTRVIVLLVALIASAGAAANANRFEVIPQRPTFAEFPMQIGEWKGEPQAPLSADVLAVLGLTDYVVRTYFTGRDQAVGLYIGYWQSQRQGETIHSPQNCLPGAGWEPTSQTIVDLPDPRTPGATFPANRYVIAKGLDRQVVLYWFQSHGRIVASEYSSKFYLIADAVRLNRTDGAIVRIIAPVLHEGDAGLAAADGLTRAFAAELVPHLDGFLPN